MTIHPLIRASMMIYMLAGVVTLSAQAAQPTAATESNPQIVNLMPVLKQHEKALKLSAEQEKFFAALMKKTPPRWAAVEEDVRSMRAQLRQLILDGGNRAQRDYLVQQLGASHAQMLMMSALDVQTIQEHLSPAQFKQLVALYRP